MFTNSVLAVTGALLSVVAAVPMAEQHHQHHQHKRDYVWITQTQEEVVTVAVTKTVWVEPGETPPSGYSAPSSSDVEPAAYTSVASAPAYTPPSSPAESSSSAPVYEAPSSTSVYVAPTPSSTSVYVAPTPSSTSVYVAPVPTTPTSTYVAPAPTTYVAPTTSSAAAYPAPSSSSGSSDGAAGMSYGVAKAGTSYTGDLTWYDVGLGACGETSVSSDPIVAVSYDIFDAYSTGNPNTNPLCGKYVSITGADGSQFKGKIVDRCPGCDEGSLDLSQDFFNSVTNYGDGRVSGMKWEFM